jgi:hypothetical protein
MPELPPDSSVSDAEADPARRWVTAYKVHRAQTFAETSAQAAIPIADPVESDRETTDQPCAGGVPGRGILREASTSRTLLERASQQLEILTLRSLELADRVAAAEIAFLGWTLPMRPPCGLASRARLATTSFRRRLRRLSQMRGVRHERELVC